MIYKLLVMLHLLGASIWIGGHVVLMAVVLPPALRQRDPEAIRRFERGFGRVGLGAMVAQLLTGIWLAGHWMGGWGQLFTEPTPTKHLVVTKLVILAALIGLAGHAYHRVLPRMTPERMTPFVVHSTLATALSLLLLVVGVGIRTGGLLP